MQKVIKTRMLAPALIATLISISADAGLKYWTSGSIEYRADSYVQDGLMLNYDGICNVGMNADHSTATTIWKNLGSGGATYDLTLTNWAEGRGAWENDGYRFTTEVGKGAYFGSPSISWDLSGQNRTIQIACDINRTDRQCETSTRNLGYIFYGMSGSKCSGNDAWRWFSVGVRSDNGTSSGVYSLACNLAYTYAVGDHFDYITSILGADYVSTFTGTTPPTSGTANTGYSKDASKRGDMTTITKFTLGGSAGQGLTGKIKSARYYNRVLDKEEIVWNRAVDDARFFGKLVSTIPATNAVIASSMAIVPANEAAGAYAVDASGYTFSAPALKTVNGRTYTCSGYTLETWNAETGDWGAPTAETGLSVSVTATDRVRITWRWTPGNGIVTRYTTADYVQDGLILHYDGICNLGADQPHSSNTTQWKNLAPNGGLDLTFATYSAVAKPGEWRRDGYRFEGQSNFKGDAIALPTNQTIQVALDGNGLDQDPYNGGGNYVNEAYIYYASGAAFSKAGSLSLRRDSNDSGNNEWIDWTVHGYGDANTRPDATATLGKSVQYFTAVLADTFGAVFYGTSVPSAETGRWTANASRRDFTMGPPTVQNATSFGIGGINNSDSRARFTGLLRNFRMYKRVLTDEELVHNRMVDDYRFHGVVPVTNIVVATSHSFLPGNEANGNYEISGTYTFSAPTGTQTDSRGFEYVLAGYTLETWNAETLGWSTPVASTESTYTWTDGTSPAKVRLTWQWKATKGLRTAADYGIEDVVPNGLVLHYDGIKNIGAESADVTNPTSSWSRAWVNLADPSQYNLARYKKTTLAGGWSSDGYAFANASSAVGAWFRYTGEFTFGPTYSIQTLLDAKVADQVDSTCSYIMFNGGTWQKAALGLRTSSDYEYALYWVCDTAFGGDTRPKIQHDSKEYTYGTAIVDGNKAAFFDGVEVPTSSGAGLVTKSTTATAQTVPQLCLGGGQGHAQDFTGTIKSFRYYDRVLTADELVRNRNVDSARYFGELAVTNVLVVAGGGEQAELGAYAVEGTWTFTASTVIGPRGVAEDVVRYVTEELVGGEWKNKQEHSGNSFTYTAGAGAMTIRLTWKGQPLGTMMTVR